MVFPSREIGFFFIGQIQTFKARLSLPKMFARFPSLLGLILRQGKRENIIREAYKLRGFHLERSFTWSFAYKASAEDLGMIWLNSKTEALNKESMEG